MLYPAELRGRASGKTLSATAAVANSLAAAGIRFTILAPHQASHVRKIAEGGDSETDASGGWREIPAVDPRRPGEPRTIREPEKTPDEPPSGPATA